LTLLLWFKAEENHPLHQDDARQARLSTIIANRLEVLYVAPGPRRNPIAAYAVA